MEDSFVQNSGYNDINDRVVTFFRVLRNREKAAQLQELLEDTPYSKVEHARCDADWPDEEDEREGEKMVRCHPARPRS